MNTPTPSKDALLQHYEQAKALLSDGLPEKPSATTRVRIMQAARENAAAQGSSDAPDLIASRADSSWAKGQKGLKNEVYDALQSTSKPPAANDSFWSIKAVASIAVMGLSALLLWQFEQGTPEEKQAVQSARPQLEATAPAPSSAPAPAPEPAATAAATANSPPQKVAQTKLPNTNATPSRSEDAVPSLPHVENRAAGSAEPAPQARERSPSLMQDSAAASAAPPQTATAEKATRPSAAAPQFKQQAEAIASAEDSTTQDNAAGARSAQVMRAPAVPPAPAPAPVARAAPAPAPAAAAPAAAPQAAPVAGLVTASTPEQRLFAAIEAQDLPALQATLRNHPATSNARRTDGQTPLHIAVQRRWRDGVRTLIAAGANPDAQNNQGQSPRDLAAGQEPLFQLLQR